MASVIGQVGVVVTVPTTSSSSSTPTASTPSTTTSTPSTPATPAPPIANGLPIRQWSLQQGEGIYFNTRSCSYAVPVPWNMWRVAYVFNDGDGILVKDKQLMTTMDLIVGYHLRRATETYVDPFPGP